MGCLFALLLVIIGPRIMLLACLVLTDWLSNAYEGALWPTLGWFFMPWTTLAYMAAKVNHGSVEGIWMVIFIIAIIADVSLHNGSARAARRKRRKESAEATQQN